MQVWLNLIFQIQLKIEFLRLGFPQGPRSSSEIDYTQVRTRSGQTVTYLYGQAPRAEHNSRHNATSRLMLHAVRANCDMKILMDAEQTLHYTTKYCTKMERSSTLFNEVLDKIFF